MISKPHRIAILVLVSFFILVPGIALLKNPNYPALVLVGEASVGTWMSGVLLIMTAALSMVMAIQKGWFPWMLIMIFFLLLAADERFMFHESFGERILFTYKSPWLSMLPVIAASMAGLMVAFVIWKRFSAVSRLLAILTVLFGSASVIFDILEAGVIMEEIFKLTGELCLVIAFTKEILPAGVK